MMSDTEKKAEEHFRRAEWVKALECFEKLLAVNQNNKNGHTNFSKDKVVAFLIGKSECNLALGRTDNVAQDCKRVLKIYNDGNNEINGNFKERARRLLLKSLVYGRRYAEAESAVKEWLVKGKVHADTRKILEQVKNRFENQGQNGQNLSPQVLEKYLIALEASLNCEDEAFGRNLPTGDLGDFHCTYCALRFPDAAALRAHCQTGSHQTVIMSDEGRDWKFRPPPRGLTSDAYSLCEGYEEKQGGCRYGEKCVDAHGLDELAEWSERFDYRRMKMQRASEKQLYGKSYTEIILDKWINAASPDHVMREKIDGVDEAISGDLVTSVSSKNSQREWTFLLKTPRKLMAVALLQDAHRNHFSLRQVSSGDAAALMSGLAWKPSNDQEWTNGPIMVDAESLWPTYGEENSGPPLEHRIRVGFKTDIYGTFRQSVVFDFGTEPILVKHLCVDVVPVSDVDKMKEIRKEVVVSTGERWCVENSEIIPFSSATVPPQSSSVLEGDKERRLLEIYPTPRADSFTLTQSTVLEKTVTRNNYRDRMHELLYVEEMARYEQVARYNLATKLTIANCYLLAPNVMSNSTAKYAHHGELFAMMTLGKDVSEDTSAGRLILNNCSTVFISSTKDNRECSKRLVYEALIEDKGKNVIYLRLSSVTVSAFNLQPDQEFPCQVQFQLNRIPYCEWHYAIDQIADYRLIFPETVLEPRIPWSPKRQWTDMIDPKLNSKQREAVIAITCPTQTLLPPILIIGPFGTGKTYTLAQAIKQLMMQPDARILVCTHSNSAADLYIKDYLHPWVEAGNEDARPLRIYYHKRWVATVNQVVQKYCLIELGNGMRSFKIPSLEDITKHRIVVVTLNISMYLSNMGLKKGHFTHILLDEAAQAMECEAIMPLALANERTKIVLAGDHMQLSPELFSNFAKERNLHVSLLERLYDHYPANNFPCKILLCENYRAHEAIINFTSELFYDQKLVSSGKQPRHDKFYPLTFFTTRGEDVQDVNSTAFYNCSEVYEVVERVSELRKKWPAAWGKLEDTSIGIMTPYSDQVFRIRSELRKRRMGNISVERVLNVQGKQFRAIFLSTVRTRRTCMGASRPGFELDFGFLSNWKLLNTAITRAQSLVAVVGDPVALCSIGRCRKVWERFLEICNDNKSLFGITWSLLRSQLDGVELKKTFTLNPLAPEFVPRALQNESYIKLPTMVAAFAPGVVPSYRAAPLNYPLFYYPPPSQAPRIFPMPRPPNGHIPYHISSPGPWPPFESPPGKKEDTKAMLALTMGKPKSPVLMDMMIPKLEPIDGIASQGIIMDNYLRPTPLHLHGIVPERHIAAPLAMSLNTAAMLHEKPDQIQFLNNVHFPERVLTRTVAPVPPPPSDWRLLLPPNHTLAEVLESRELQMRWYRHLISVSVEMAERFKDLVVQASEKPMSPVPVPEPIQVNWIERTAELNLNQKPLLLREIEAAIMSQTQQQQQQQQPQQQPPPPMNIPPPTMNMPPPNVPPPTMQQHHMNMPPPTLPLYRRHPLTFEQQQQQGMFMQPPPPIPSYHNDDFHLNGREQDLEEPSTIRPNVEMTYASVLRAQNTRSHNPNDAHDPFGLLKNLARSGTSHGSSGLYQYFS